MKEGLLVVLSGPSGTGKGTLLDKLKCYNERIRLSVSATTRQPRNGEVDGRDYFFKTVDEFKSMIKNNDFIEWVKYCSNYYGTPREFVEQSVKDGYDVVFEIEVEGALRVKNQYPQSVLVFVLPPSFDELEKRIKERGTEDPYIIKKRLERAKDEMKYIGRYDYVVINDIVQTAAKNIEGIIKSEKLKFKRNKDVLENICIE